MSLTAEDAYHAEFGNAQIGRRGYAKHEVDAFIGRIAKTLANEDDLTAAEVHHIEFNRPLLGKRGYDEREVDAFLERAETALAERGSQAHPLPSARTGDEATGRTHLRLDSRSS